MHVFQVILTNLVDVEILIYIVIFIKNLMDNTSSFMILKTVFSIIIDYLEIKRILANLYFEIGVLWSHFFICSMMLQISFFIFFYHQIY